jgi:putative GTP pyrophosphokinase
MAEKTSIGEVIEDTLELRRLYEANRERYSRFLNLVTLVLNCAIQKKNIKVHSISQRIKDYNSFLEKVERKRYSDPFQQCTDIVGCRVICLFQSQVEEIKKIIEEEFEVIEETDKKSLKKFDQFGYLSLHMLIKIPKNRTRFIECCDLNDFMCEVQVRTILQEAWAEIEHYLNYKSAKEQENKELLRKIYSLAGMFEVADSTFEDIHAGFSDLMKRGLESEDESITALNLYKFSSGYFSWYHRDWDKREERGFLKLSKEARNINIKTIKTLKEILDKYNAELDSYERYHQATARHLIEGRFFSPVGLIRAGLALEFGKKFDLVFGLKGYSDKVRNEIGFKE